MILNPALSNVPVECVVESVDANYFTINNQINIIINMWMYNLLIYYLLLKLAAIR